MLSRKIVIGCIQPGDIYDKKASSGVPYKMCESLRKIGAETVWIEEKKTFLFNILEFICKILSKIFNRTVIAEHYIFGAYLLSKKVDKKLIEKCDLLFFPLSASALYTLKTNKPIIYESDATFNVMIDYYFKNLTKTQKLNGNKIQKRAMDKASCLIFASDWAANDAKKFYKQAPDKVFVVEYGANLDDKDIKFIPKKFEEELEILFLGVEWDRKGGDIAIEACKFLNKNGVNVKLNIVGINELPNNIKQLPFVNNIGFLNKNNNDEYKKLVKVINDSHLLLLPTKAECAGIVFCECSAFGLPIFSHETGGIPNYVINDVNGYLLPLGSTGEDFGKKILECINNKKLEQLSNTARQLYLEKLNWDKWGRTVESIIEKLV